MLQAQRHERLLEAVNRKGIVTTEELMRTLGISIATLRRDINQLSDMGLIEKVRGGAKALSNRTATEPTLREKALRNAPQKKKIALEAVTRITDGETIILDSGTTTLELAKLLARFTHLTVITNDLLIALEVSTNTANRLIFIGGTMRANFCSSYGYHAENMLKGLSADKLFFSVDAIDADSGMMSFITDDINLKTIGMRQAQASYLLCDHSKFGLRALFAIGMLENLTQIITDTGLSDAKREAFEKAGIHLVCV
ncbi:MAG TPA: DeoR/GlpR transcriptional regulator [Sutterella sp.]|nr:DeoR/GlpR transcriptional regulator [Sutterella sp.]